MGNIIKKKIKIYENNSIYLICDNNGIIKEVSENVLEKLGYNDYDLRERFIGILMNEFMSYLHKEILLKRYQNLNIIEKKVVHLFLSAHSSKRPLIIYDVYKNPNFVNLSVNILSEYKESIEQYFSGKNINYVDNWFLLKIDIVDDSNLFMYTMNYKNLTDSFVQSKNNVIIICIDFINSTLNMQNENGVNNLIQINKNFYKDIVYLIKHYYYPYVYIHEIIGDSFVLLINADWTYNIPKYCTTIALNFVTQLNNRSKEYVQSRIGISYGKISYGNIGDHFRIFGNTINMASRLENQSIINNVVVDKPFFSKLKDEYSLIKNTSDTSYIDNLTTHKLCVLKGFGSKDCYFINIENKSNFIYFQES